MLQLLYDEWFADDETIASHNAGVYNDFLTLNKELFDKYDESLNQKVIDHFDKTYSDYYEINIY